MAVTPLVDRALAAVDESFSGFVKRECDQLAVNIDGGEDVKSAAAHFSKGLRNLKLAREAAIPIVRDIFKDAT